MTNMTREAVERLALWYEGVPWPAMFPQPSTTAGEHTAATLRALLSRAEAAEAERDAARADCAALVEAARREEREAAARVVEAQAEEAQSFSDRRVSDEDAKVWGDYAEDRRELAAAIRARGQA